MTEGVTPIQSVGGTSIAPRQSHARRANIKCDLSHTRGPGAQPLVTVIKLRDQFAVFGSFGRPKEHSVGEPSLALGDKACGLIKDLIHTDRQGCRSLQDTSSTILRMVPLPQGELTEGQEKVAWAITKGRQYAYISHAKRISHLYIAREAYIACRRHINNSPQGANHENRTLLRFAFRCDYRL